MFKPTIPAWKLLFPLALLIAACGQARYELPTQAVGLGAPQQVSAQQQPPAAVPNPTARVEVIAASQSVTTVAMGTPTIIQPSWDTVSPSFIGQTSCVNPGIVSASYVVGNLTTLSAQRSTNGCETLGQPYTFAVPGNYVITMTVTDANNKTATASMTLTVTQPGTNDGGFTITVNPIVTQINKPITFTGYCNTPGALTITWVFADGSTATGPSVQHAYSQDGQYLVTASCANADNSNVKTASVTLVIADQVYTIPNPPANDTPATPVTPTITPPVQTTYQGPAQSTYQGPAQSTYQGPAQVTGNNNALVTSPWSRKGSAN